MSHPPHEDWDEHDVRGTSARSTFDDDVLGLRRYSEHDESLADDVLDPAAVADPAFGCRFTDPAFPHVWLDTSVCPATA